MKRLARAQRFGLALALGTVGMACGSNEPRLPVGVDTNRSVTGAGKPRVPENPVTGYMVAQVNSRAIGPFFARRGAGANAAGMVAWVTGLEGTGRRILTVPVGADGSPRGSETVAANVSIDTTMFVAKPLGGKNPGFLFAWTALTDRGKSLWTVAVSDNGVPRAKPVEIVRTTDDLVWVDIVPTEHGAVCLWAEETRENDANLSVAAVDDEGTLRGVPTRLAREVIGWHALELPNGVGVSTVTAASAAKTSAAASKPASDTRSGTLTFHRLDADGHGAAAPTVITSKPTITGDVTAVRDGKGIVFGWTDRSNTEPVVAMATLDEKNVVGPQRTLVDARGGASLLGLASGPNGMGVVFESPARRRGETRYAHVARVGPQLTLGSKPVSFEVLSRSSPELVATGTGFAAVATTRDCDDRSPSCLSSNPVSMLYRIDEKGALVQREAFTFQTDPAALAWNLTCDTERCITLAASSDAETMPTRIRTTAVRFRSNHAETPAPAKAPPRDETRIADVIAVVAGERVADIAAAASDKGHIVALLGDRLRDGSRRIRAARDPRHTSVTLDTRVVDEDGTVGAPTVLSSRALVVGGVAIANADAPEEGSALAWVSIETGDPEVHVTRLDKRGRRVKDIQLTSAKGDASNVAITWTGNGYVVAWVDWRNGNGEVYAARLGPDLARSGREERITNAPGDASDLVALAHGDAVWLAWADPRDSVRDGSADVFVSAVRKDNAKRLLDEARILPTAAHSRTPRLAAGPNGLTVAWIEEAPPGAATPSSSGYGAFWTTFDAAGKPVGKPNRIPLAGDGAATTVALDRSGARAVVARSTVESISLDAVDLTPTGRPTSLLSLDGPPSLDVALVFDGPFVFFNDDGMHPEDRRARRARVLWPR